MKFLIKSSLVMLTLCSSYTIKQPSVASASFDQFLGQVNTSSSQLNIRKSATTSSNVIGKLNKGTYLTVINESSGWYYIEYSNNKFGYVKNNYIKKVASKEYYVTASKLNVRSGDSTKYKVINQLNKNELVYIISTNNSFSKIVYNANSVGFVSNNYLSTNQVSSLAYPSKTLNVTSYKQYDSRWANVKLGSSSATMKQSGCTTTAISMLESYRQQTSILPSSLAKKLSYTSSGALYWPTNLTVSTSKTNYLNVIYQNLTKNKPTILGCKKANGGQHYVVIYGFTGGNSLSTSNFKIHDPGSSSRSTLAEFLNAYPNFYKLVSY